MFGYWICESQYEIFSLLCDSTGVPAGIGEFQSDPAGNGFRNDVPGAGGGGGGGEDAGGG
jgi:hypothetical protein